MHHFIYPSKDTYITNRSGYEDKNFALDELLQVGTINQAIIYTSATKDYGYTNQIFSSYHADSFSGSFTGSLEGTASFIYGTMSGSNLDFSITYFSGSVDGVSAETSGSVSGSLVNGFITGSGVFQYQTGLFTGYLNGATVCMTGTGSGVDTHNEATRTVGNAKFVDRALIAFDIAPISAAMSRGEITNPKFSLKMKVCNEYELPITYTIYACPLSQSWNMGDGTMAEGGSDEGVSWTYRDNNYGTMWSSITESGLRPAIDFVNNPSLVTASFAYGGGTWYTSSFASQSFSYQSADIDMDVTSIVSGWITGSFPNQGFVLMHSDELQSTGSGFILTFYGNDTNTIYAPYLDVMWNDVTWETGSVSTGSVAVSTMNSGITASVQSGSSFSIASGISGSFSSSAMLMITANYIVADGQIFNYSAPNNATTNDIWYSNNGYHYDSWQTAWQLDPYHGGFLPNTDIQIAPTAPDYGSPPIYQFTGSFTGSFFGTASFVGTFSGSGQFSASYFTGSVDSISYEVTSGSVSGSLVSGSVIGTVTATSQVGMFSGHMEAAAVYLNGTGSGTYLDSTFNAFSGFADGKGLTGNITGVPVFGKVTGLATIGQSLITGSCGKAFSASLAKAIFDTGPFSGSAFTAYYIDYKFVNAMLTGSWIPAAFLGANVYVKIPSGIDPYAYATVQGTYVNGTALGLYTISGSTSASFSGQFIDGNLLGGLLYVQLSGSVYTSSFAYTSSVEMTSSYLTALDAERPFSIALQGVKPTYKAGDIAKIGVFGRKQYPLKQFGKVSQQEQYVIPEYLPSSSFYALKDNQTDEIVLNFDSYTQLSCEYPYGNYFVVDTTSLPQERYYRVLIQVQDGGEIYTIDTGKTFKVTR